MATKAKTIDEVLAAIQCEIKAPKGQFNSFGKYRYRSVEDIQQALKPMLEKHGGSLTLSDDIACVGERYYIRATATFRYAGEERSVTAFAREEESKKGMDAAQLSGATSSYSRKYALGAMLLLDDTADSDATNTHGKEDKKPSAKPRAKATQKPSDITVELIEQQTDAEVLRRWYRATKDDVLKLAIKARAEELAQ